MSFIQREINRIRVELADGVEGKEQLYAAQQALCWALEPSGVKSPYDMIMGGAARPPVIEPAPN